MNGRRRSVCPSRRNSTTPSVLYSSSCAVGVQHLEPLRHRVPDEPAGGAILRVDREPRKAEKSRAPAGRPDRARGSNESSPLTWTTSRTLPTTSSSASRTESSRKSIAAVTGWFLRRTRTSGAGSKRTRSPSSVNRPSVGGVDAGSTMSLVAALPALLGPGFKTCRACDADPVASIVGLVLRAPLENGRVGCRAVCHRRRLFRRGRSRRLPRTRPSQRSHDLTFLAASSVGRETLMGCWLARPM